MLLQLVQVAEIADPTVTDELLQRGRREALDVHAGLLAKMGEFLHQLGGAVRIFTEELPRASGRPAGLQRFPTAGAGHGEPVGVALRFVAGNLRDDHVGLIDRDGIPDAKLERIKNIQIVQIGAAHRRPVHENGVE